MPKPINKLGVTKDLILQIGACATRLRRSLKHADKLNDEDKMHIINVALKQMETLKKQLERDLVQEYKRVKNPATFTYRG